MSTIEITEAKLDEALAIIIDTIGKVADAVLEPADAEMFMTELDGAFGILNRDLGVE
jgi:hypothetical protein